MTKDLAYDAIPMDVQRIRMGINQALFTYNITNARLNCAPGRSKWYSILSLQFISKINLAALSDFDISMCINSALRISFEGISSESKYGRFIDVSLCALNDGYPETSPIVTSSERSFLCKTLKKETTLQKGLLLRGMATSSIVARIGIPDDWSELISSIH